MEHEIDTSRFTNFKTLEELVQAEQKYARRFRHDRTPAVNDISMTTTFKSAPRTEADNNYVNDQIIKPRKFAQVMPYSDEGAKIDARNLFALVLIDIQKRKTEAQGGAPFKLVWTKEQATVIRQLIKHAINDPSCEIPLHKGWYLYGDMRIGKTLLATALNAFHGVIESIYSKRSPKEFNLHDVRQMYSNWNMGGMRRPDIRPYVIGDVTFDDAGIPAELEGVTVGGKTVDPIAEILWTRHERWTRFGHITCFTSNVPFMDVYRAGNMTPIATGYTTRFDDRLKARLHEMIHPILLPSPPLDTL